MQAWLEEILSKPTTSVPLAGRALGLSRNSSYEAAIRGEIYVLTFGKKTGPDRVVEEAASDR